MHAANTLAANSQPAAAPLQGVKPTNESTHPRVALPMRVRAKRGTFAVIDWTPRDIALADAAAFMEGETVDLTLMLPFDGYAFSLNVKGEVRSVSPADRRTAIAFVDLDDRQEALLRYLNEQAMAGRVFGAGHILEVASRSATAQPRPIAAPVAMERGERFKARGRRLAASAGVFAILGTLGAYLWANVYQELYVVEAESAQVLAKTVNVASPSVGRIGYLNDDPQVALGDPILTVMPAVGDPITVQSPCDCLQVDQAFTTGDFVKTGDPIIRLRRADAPIVIAAAVPSEKIMDIYGASRATVVYADGERVNGVDILWLPGQSDPNNNLPRMESTVLLDPTRQPGALMIGEPVRVTFDLFEGSWLGQLWTSLAKPSALAEVPGQQADGDRAPQAERAGS